jgi:hypothetical protein
MYILLIYKFMYDVIRILHATCCRRKMSLITEFRHLRGMPVLCSVVMINAPMRVDRCVCERARDCHARTHFEVNRTTLHFLTLSSIFIHIFTSLFIFYFFAFFNCLKNIMSVHFKIVFRSVR